MGEIKVTTDSWWHLGDYVDRWGDTLERRRLRATAVDDSILCIFKCRRVWHDSCVGIGRRRRSVLDRNQAVLLRGVSSPDMLFMQCTEELSNCQNLRDVMAIVNVLEVPAETD